MPERRAATLAAVLFTLVFGLAGCAQQPGIPGGSGEAAAVENIPAAEPLSPEQQSQLDRALEASARGEWSSAAEALTGLLAARPGHPDLLARLAWVRQQQEDSDAAMALYRQALAADPDHLMARNNLALLLQEAGDFASARNLLQGGLDRGLEAPELHYNLAVLSELYLLDLETALTHYRAYQRSSARADSQVKGWIADLERRLK